jgi:hypothetical protein
MEDIDSLWGKAPFACEDSARHFREISAKAVKEGLAITTIPP